MWCVMKRNLRPRNLNSKGQGGNALSWPALWRPRENGSQGIKKNIATVFFILNRWATSQSIRTESSAPDRIWTSTLRTDATSSFRPKRAELRIRVLLQRIEKQQWPARPSLSFVLCTLPTMPPAPHNSETWALHFLPTLLYLALAMMQFTASTYFSPCGGHIAVPVCNFRLPCTVVTQWFVAHLPMTAACR